MRAILPLVSAVLLVCASGAALAQDRIVAIVNNEAITQKDLEAFITFTRIQLSQKLSGKELDDKIASLRQDLLQRLIEDRLILQEAKKSGIKIDDARVKAKMSEVKKRYNSDKEFTEALVLQGLSEGDIESRIKDQMLMYSLIDQKIRSKIQVKPAEITAYFEQNKKDMESSEKREVVSIQAENEDAARAIVDALRQGKDMDALAQEHNTKVNTFVTQAGELKKEVDDAVFALKAVSDVSDPVNVNGTFYVFRLKQITPRASQTLADVQDEISSLLYEKKMQEAVAAWLEDLKKAAYIKITE
ncbi:MAG: SurA N-terminal domain-containing protein [Deltaproteobacteria bacterium]